MHQEKIPCSVAQAVAPVGLEQRYRTGSLKKANREKEEFELKVGPSGSCCVHSATEEEEEEKGGRRGGGKIVEERAAAIFRRKETVSTHTPQRPL